MASLDGTSFDAGVGGDAGADDMGWDATGSPWASGATAAAFVSGEDSASAPSARQPVHDSADDAQATAASDDEQGAQASVDANAILLGTMDSQAAGPSSKGTRLAGLEIACVVRGKSRLPGCCVTGH